MKSSTQRNLESAFNGLAGVAAKWRKRAWRFRDAYNDALGQVQALEIQKLQLEAYGADKTQALITESLQRRMLELAMHREGASN